MQNHPFFLKILYFQVTDAYTDLEKDEVRIVTGALVLKQKSVKVQTCLNVRM